MAGQGTGVVESEFYGTSEIGITIKMRSCPKCARPYLTPIFIGASVMTPDVVTIECVCGENIKHKRRI